MTAEQSTSQPDSGAADAADAVSAAREAFDHGPWGKSTGPERAEKLFALADLVEKHAEEFAKIDTENNGKPLREASYDAADAAGCFRYYAGLAGKPQGQTYSVSDPNMVCMTVREPIGVCAQIIPWNYPLLMAVWKLAPGLAAGNACILKPSEMTPVSAVKLFELIEQAGFPPGAANLVLGPGDPVGSALAASDRVDKVAFTGSTEVGRILMRQSAGTLKKMSLELGGNAPLIVFDDADIDTAIAGTMASKYRNAGQTCVCANRIFVQDGIYDEFARRLTEATAAMKVGNGMEDGVEQGPIIDGQGLDKIERHVADARAKGAEVLTGGGRHALGGTYFEPTVLTGMTPEMEMFREETFGPVAGLFRFSTDDEAVAMANDTEFGLAAYIFTNNTSRLFRVSEALEYGMVSANTGIFSSEVGPFGGVKSSGLGREGSKYGIDEFLEIKFVCVGL